VTSRICGRKNPGNAMHVRRLLQLLDNNMLIRKRNNPAQSEFHLWTRIDKTKFLRGADGLNLSQEYFFPINVASLKHCLATHHVMYVIAPGRKSDKRVAYFILTSALQKYVLDKIDKSDHFFYHGPGGF